MSTTLPEPDQPAETPKERRARLVRVLGELEAAGGSAFLDLCDLLALYAQRVDGMMKWTNGRVIVHIKHPPRKAQGSR